jgi:hypothetical protein
MSAWTSRLGWLAAALLPPVVVTAVRPETLARHPVVTAIGTLLYWIAVAVTKYAGSVATELGGRWRGRIVDRVDGSTRRRFSRFAVRYRRYLLRTVQFIDLNGLATRGPNDPKLDEVYVDVRLAPRAPHQVPSHLLADIPDSVRERHDIWDQLDRPEPALLAVVGAPGSGKTTLLKHTATRVCRRPKHRRRRVPILLYLRDHVPAITADPGIGLPELVVAALGRLRSEAPPDWFDLRLRAGDCLVLLDGLDEVASDEHRRVVSRWVFDQTRHWPDNDYVITSRPQGYRTAPVEGATVLQVCQFTDEQVDRFVRGWYLAIERHCNGAEDEDVRHRAQEHSDDLLERLRNAPSLIDLTANPLLLTMIATVHRYRGALPGSRADLYREICEVMLWRRQEAKRLETRLGGDKSEKVLRHLAYAMMAARVRDLPRDKVLVEIRSALRRVSKTVTAEEFLADAGSNGLLLERESGVFTFAHLTFQEYLASAQLRDHGLRDVARLVEDVWWRETLLLYAATANADPIIEACLRRNTITTLALAFDCEDQGSDIAPELRTELEQLLAHATEFAGDLEHRRLLVGVMATRYLHNAVSTSGGARVCVKPVPPELFRVFLREQGLPTEVDLIHRLHAMKFPQWLDDFSGHALGGRLPSSAELDEPVVRRTLFSPANTYRVPWADGEKRLPAREGRDPHAIAYSVVAQRLAADVAEVGTTLAQFIVRCASMAAPGDQLLCSSATLGRDGIYFAGVPQSSPIVSRLVSNLAGVELPKGGQRIDRLLGMMGDRLGELDHLLALDQGTRLSHPVRTMVRGAIQLADLTPSHREEVFRSAFARFLAKTRAVLDDTISFELLPNLLSLTSAYMIDLKKQQVSLAAERFDQFARPYVSLRRAVTPESARFIRLAAMVLAAQAEEWRHSHACIGYRRIAAAVTILEERECGTRTDREMLVLAVS